MVINNNDFFVRGPLTVGEKFFLVAQCEIVLPTKEEIIVNFVASWNGQHLVFSSVLPKRPTYFTHTFNRSLNLYHENKKIGPSLNLYPTRQVEKNQLFSGLWTFILTPEHWEMPIKVEVPIYRPEFFQKSIRGAIQTLPSGNFKFGRINRTMVFAFLPEKYFDQHLRTLETWNKYKLWLEEDVPRGTSQKDLKFENYLPFRRTVFEQKNSTHSPALTSRWQNKKHVTLSDLLKEEEEEKLFQDDFQNEAAPKSFKVLWIVIFILLIALIYLVFFDKSKNEDDGGRVVQQQVDSKGKPGRV